MLDMLAPQWPGLNDFRSNGLLLPCREATALRLALPLHRGPHGRYNAMVAERVGRIEAEWRRNTTARRCEQALFRLLLLQRTLRRLLLDANRRRPMLNRRDPGTQTPDLAELDALADSLWCRTGEPGTGTVSQAAFAALSTARTLAVATSSSMPTPQTVWPSASTHST